MPEAPVVRRSFRRAGRLVPAGARRLHSRAIILPPGHAVDWHSTQRREELLVILEGSVSLEVRGRARSVRCVAGTSVFLAPGVWHRVVNRTGHRASYIYVTG